MRLAKISLLLILLLSAFSGLDAQPKKEIVAFFGNWKWYHRNKLVNPQTIDYSLYTVINYGFFGTLKDGTILSMDSTCDKQLLNTKGQGTSMVEMAHKNGVRIGISVGGWTYSNNFSPICASPVYTAKFAHDCLELTRKYNLDGIDIDWEHPCFAENNGHPEDKQNFTKLLRAVRDSLNTSPKHLFLSACVSLSPARIDNVEWKKLSDIVDEINLMSYNYYGRWNPEVNHNAPLYPPLKGKDLYNIDDMLQALTRDYKVPADKLIIGLAFFGHSVKTTGPPVLFGPSEKKGDMDLFKANGGTPTYYNIISNKHLFNEYWDSLAMVPYLTGKDSLHTFISYDNERSIEIKSRYVMNNGFKGVFLWDMAGDYIESYPGSGVVSATPLASTVKKVFYGTDHKPMMPASLVSPKAEVTLHTKKHPTTALPRIIKKETPKPSKNVVVKSKYTQLTIVSTTKTLIIQCDQKTNKLCKDINIFDITGKHYLDSSLSKGIYLLTDLAKYPAGTYYVELTTDNGSTDLIRFDVPSKWE